MTATFSRTELRPETISKYNKKNFKIYVTVIDNNYYFIEIHPGNILKLFKIIVT